jgi:hypothetical protein
MNVGEFGSFQICHARIGLGSIPGGASVGSFQNSPSGP